MSTAIMDRLVELPEPEDDGLYEVIDGQRVEKLIGIRQLVLANHLAFFINQVAFAPRLGIALVEGLFDLGNSGSRQFRPDVAFVSEGRWPRDRQIPPTNAWAVVPDLAVEVVSPSNSANEVEGKVVEYLKAGVRLVWVVHPSTARIYVHDGSPTVRVVSRDGELDGGDILPGFRLPLSALFETGPA